MDPLVDLMASVPFGGLVSIAILAPNLLWMLCRPSPAPAQTVNDRSLGIRLLGVLEQCGRLGVFVIPFFYGLHFEGAAARAGLTVLLLSLAVYYAGWVRYFAGGRGEELLFRSFCWLPVPMAVSPVIAFGAAAVLLHAVPLGVATLMLGTSHIPLSYREARRLGLPGTSWR